MIFGENSVRNVQEKTPDFSGVNEPRLLPDKDLHHGFKGASVIMKVGPNFAVSLSTCRSA